MLTEVHVPKYYEQYLSVTWWRIAEATGKTPREPPVPSMWPVDPFLPMGIRHQPPTGNSNVSEGRRFRLVQSSEPFFIKMSLSASGEYCTYY